MKIEGEGIIFSEELYLNYIYQFGFEEGKDYRVRTFTIKQIVGIIFNQCMMNHSLIELNKILKEYQKKK